MGSVGQRIHITENRRLLLPIIQNVAVCAGKLDTLRHAVILKLVIPGVNPQWILWRWNSLNLQEAGFA